MYVLGGLKNPRNSNPGALCERDPLSQWGGWLGIQPLGPEFKARTDQVWSVGGRGGHE